MENQQLEVLERKVGQLIIENDFLKKKLGSLCQKERREMIEMNHENLSVRRQCSLLELNRSTIYYKTVERVHDTILANEINELWNDMPFYGYRRMTAELRRRRYQLLPSKAGSS
ncbi:IS3 family transposase domain protein [Candidatus Bealeia paramacronuclearis]|uniref:IS3 family transposase domain protein n=1 Tax=Candidatus Bealeia paramacronuclearis TaxID=1921001 RepID=A0ABZ2C7Q3_9PROT|nr:IS3 family transposase domain protein [Candidatus Bealeia paramacronuclearis]